MKFALLYFSATGGTKLLAELLLELLGTESGETLDIHDPAARDALRDADFSVFCFPTYFLKPARPMVEFVESVRAAGGGRRAFVLATCELYSENSPRRLAL